MLVPYKTLLVLNASFGTFNDVPWGSLLGFSIDDPVPLDGLEGREVPSYRADPDFCQSLEGNFPCFVKVLMVPRSGSFFISEGQVIPDTKPLFLDYFSKFKPNYGLSFFVLGAKYIHFTDKAGHEISLGNFIAINVLEAQQQGLFRIQNLKAEPELIKAVSREHKGKFPAVFDFDFKEKMAKDENGKLRAVPFASSAILHSETVGIFSEVLYKVAHSKPSKSQPINSEPVK